MTRLLHVAGLATTLISHSPAAADYRVPVAAMRAMCVAAKSDPCDLVPR